MARAAAAFFYEAERVRGEEGCLSQPGRAKAGMGHCCQPAPILLPRPAPLPCLSLAPALSQPASPSFVLSSFRRRPACPVVPVPGHDAERPAAMPNWLVIIRSLRACQGNGMRCAAQEKSAYAGAAVQCAERESAPLNL